jgi:hypothetical protein
VADAWDADDAAGEPCGPALHAAASTATATVTAAAVAVFLMLLMPAQPVSRR